MNRIFDTHVHYNEACYDEDRESFLANLVASGVSRVTNIATNVVTSLENDLYTRKYDFMYGTVGAFPTEVDCLSEPGAMDTLERLLASSDKLVAVGEIGLDYHYDDVEKSVQKEYFEAQMDLARRAEVPIVIHSRDAAKDTLDIMRGAHAEEIGGVMHCYSYTKEVAREVLDLDFFFGIGGVVTFKNAKKLKEAVDYIPLSHIVLETDAPYLTPEPFRGKRNSSAYLSYVAEAIASIKGITAEEVYAATWDNACRLYKIREESI